MLRERGAHADPADELMNHPLVSLTANRPLGRRTQAEFNPPGFVVLPAIQRRRKQTSNEGVHHLLQRKYE